MPMYDVERWHDLFVMMGGATAALAGLIFVAVSLNQEEILAGPRLPQLALRTLGTLVALVVFCMLGLAPQPVEAFGAELLVASLALVGLIAATGVHERRPEDPRVWQLSNVGLGVVSSVPAVLAAVSLLAQVGGGLAWLLVELLTGTLVAVLNAWVLLIEIKR